MTGALDEVPWLGADLPREDNAVWTVLAADSDAATLLKTRSDGYRSIVKAARAGTEKLDALRFQWQVLSLFSDQPGFPGPRPLARLPVMAQGEGIELSYLPGVHPRFESDEDFRVLGATLARFHSLSRGVEVAGAARWDLPRVERHFRDPRLSALLSTEELGVVSEALERFGPRYQEYLQRGEWTGLVHSDSHRHNVVVEGGRGWLIDFGECGHGVLFWDLGVAVADSVVDAPRRAPPLRRSILEGYLSVLPDASAVVEKDLSVFEALRSLEVVTWPVSNWTEARRAEDQDQARENIEASVEHLQGLLTVG